MGVCDQLVVLQAATLIAEGLWNAHTKMEITHSDLKPNNILVEEDKETGVLNVSLIDFGFAKDASAAGAYEGSQAMEPSAGAHWKLPHINCKHYIVPAALVRMRIRTTNLIFGNMH